MTGCSPAANAPGSPRCAPRCSRGRPGARSSSAPVPAPTLSHYPAAVTEVVLTEPDPHMARRLRDKLAAEPPGSRPRWSRPAPSSCPSTTTPSTPWSRRWSCARSTTRRAPRPRSRACCGREGSLLLLEHVRDPDDGRLGGWQDRLERPWGWFAGGCHPNRDTAATLARAGFDVAGLEAGRASQGAAPGTTDDRGVGEVRRRVGPEDETARAAGRSGRGCCR